MSFSVGPPCGVCHESTHSPLSAPLCDSHSLHQKCQELYFRIAPHISSPLGDIFECPECPSVFFKPLERAASSSSLPGMLPEELLSVLHQGEASQRDKKSGVALFKESLLQQAPSLFCGMSTRAQNINTYFQCVICYGNEAPLLGGPCGCHALYHQKCLAREFTSQRVRQYEGKTWIRCPNCTEPFTEQAIKRNTEIERVIALWQENKEGFWKVYPWNKEESWEKLERDLSFVTRGKRNEQVTQLFQKPPPGGILSPLRTIIALITVFLLVIFSLLERFVFILDETESMERLNQRVGWVGEWLD